MRALLTLVLISLTALISSAQMDSASRDLLIDKLSKVQAQLPANDPSNVSVTLRLADLLADRARVNAMTELENGCTDCKAGVTDRQKALRLYTETVDRAPMAAKGKIMIQMGHLSQMNGNEAKAQQFYNKALTEQVAPEIKAEAYLALGEMAFKARSFAAAINHYDKVLDIPAAGSKGLAAYRKAWSTFNLGRVEDAQKQLEHILRTPALLTRSSIAQAQVDPQFQEEVSRDLASFISKAQITKDKIETLHKLSPDSAKTSNLLSLAADAERLGRKSEALAVWAFIFPYLSKPEDRLNAHAALTQLYFESGDKKSAMNEFSKVTELLGEKGACSASQCEEIRRRLRQSIVGWNQIEKKNPSADLLSAYTQYVKTFPDDTDMVMFAAQVAKDQNNLAAADSFYGQAQGKFTQDKKDADKLESVLLLRIEIAETLKDEAKLKAAYNAYLTNSPKQTRSFQVRYQMARATYEANQYEQAATELQKLAMDTQGDEKIRKQAADLSLDALVLLKDDARLKTWSTQYAQTFKGSAKEFAEISQKTILTETAQLAANNPEQAYAALAQFNPDQAGLDDKIKFYKNKMILAEKLKKFSDLTAAADQLLKQPGLTAEDTELAWAKKAQVAELRLDFPNAITATEKLQKAYQPEDKALKLALFSELAGQDRPDRYVQYLKLAKDAEAKKLVAQELVRKSKNPEKEIEALKSYLSSSPEALARLYAEIQAKNPNSMAAKKVLAAESLKKTPSGQLLARADFLKEFDVFKTKLAASKLDASNDRKLASSIKSRAALLEQLEARTKTAIDRGDWTSQLVSIDTLAKESDRFYQELMSAPVPAGLSGEEEQEYLNLLGNQAAPFQAKAMAAKEKVEQFWKESSWLSNLQKAWDDKAVRSLTAIEVKALQAIAPADTQAGLAALQANTVEKENMNRPQPQLIALARNKVFQQPTDKAAVEELLKLEKQADNKSMVQYLQTRLENINKGAL